VPVEQSGNKIVVIRTEKGVVAFEDVCPHALWPLSGGTVRDGILECAGHCWEFSLETGQCIDVPDYCLKAIPMTVQGDNVRLEAPSIRSADHADEASTITAPAPTNAATQTSSHSEPAS
jgi:nitrite reductase/ring-hydroxylating ferredoxin subunit